MSRGCKSLGAARSLLHLVCSTLQPFLLSFFLLLKAHLILTFSLEKASTCLRIVKSKTPRGRGDRKDCWGGVERRKKKISIISHLRKCRLKRSLNIFDERFAVLHSAQFSECPEESVLAV